MTLFEKWAEQNAEIAELRAELEDTRKDRNTAEAEVKDLKAIIARTLHDVDALLEYIRGR